MPIAVFFPRRGDNTKPAYSLARALCAECRVREACLDEVMATEDPMYRVEFRRGLTGNERRALSAPMGKIRSAGPPPIRRA
jgi:hypothetical protein